MQDVIIKVPLFSVDEGSIENKSALQKSFQQVVSRMYNGNGMYFKQDREIHYTITGRKIVKLDEVRFFVFGEVFKISDAKLSLGVKYPYLIKEFERFEEMGFDEIAYNSAVQKIIPFNDEQMVILEEDVAENLYSNQGYSSNSSRVWLFSEPLFKPVCFNQADYEPVVLSELLKSISLNFDDYQGIEVFERNYYGDGSSEIKPAKCQYVFEDAVVGKNLLANMFSDNKSSLRLINKSPGLQMILDQKKRLLPIPENAIILRRAVIRKWMKS